MSHGSFHAIVALTGDHITLMDIQERVPKPEFVKREPARKGIHLRHNRYWNHLQAILNKIGDIYVTGKLKMVRQGMLEMQRERW